MTPHNRVLVLVGGVALIASVSIGLVLVQTTATDATLQADQSSAQKVQALGDDLLVQVNEQHDELDDYILSQDPQALAQYRMAVAAESAIALRIGAASAGLAGVAGALSAVDAENDAWRLATAEPAIAALQTGRSEAVNEAIQIRIQDREASQAVTGELLVAIDAAEAELGRRSDALGEYRVGASIAGVAIELLAAGLSLWFVRRYGLRVIRDDRRRIRASAERIEIVASLRTLRTHRTPEETAAVIAEALTQLPWVDVASVFERTETGVVALAVAGLPGFPIRVGARLGDEQARYLLERSQGGPWAEQWVDDANLGPDEQSFVGVGIKSSAFAPILIEGEIIGLIGFATTDDDHGRHLVEDLPAVGEFASVAEAILAPALIARRLRVNERRRIETMIAARAFRPVFQPIVDLATGGTVGFEALTRFDDGSPPDIMFAAALECGMGIELEIATLEAAVRESRQLAPGAWLSLNVSPTLLALRCGLDRLMAERAGQIVVEITEHEVILAYGPLREAMVELGPRVRLAVDDAGAGVANFNHLVELRPSFVKIDASLVRGVDADPSRRAVVVGLIHFAAEAGCEVIAEGIETEAERATVAELGVTLGQGYLLGRPAAAETWTVPIVPNVVRLLARAQSVRHGASSSRVQAADGEPRHGVALRPVILESSLIQSSGGT
jgi:EAL domain-containing protein (putative c-di-GMP-specific phosphodiesterase class I)/CHASE3 domain sensor protein